MKLMPPHRSDSPGPWWPPRSAALAALIFCVSTFCVSAFRASLNPDEVFDLYNPKRIVLIVAGALVFWLSIHGRAGARPGLKMLRRMALVGLPGLMVLFVLAMAMDIWVLHDTAKKAMHDDALLLLALRILVVGVIAVGCALHLRDHLDEKKDEFDSVKYVFGEACPPRSDFSKRT